MNFLCPNSNGRQRGSITKELLKRKKYISRIGYSQLRGTRWHSNIGQEELNPKTGRKWGFSIKKFPKLPTLGGN